MDSNNSGNARILQNVDSRIPKKSIFIDMIVKQFYLYKFFFWSSGSQTMACAPPVVRLQSLSECDGIWNFSESGVFVVLKLKRVEH